MKELMLNCEYPSVGGRWSHDVTYYLLDQFRLYR